jgi:hypothetical protein
MTVGELTLCLVVFGAVSLLTCHYLKRRRVGGWGARLAFFPGFIFANIASWLVSRPGDRLLQPNVTVYDVPVIVGFPLSFYAIGPWRDQLYLLAFIVNIAIVAVLGITFAHSCEVPADEPGTEPE